ncbi:FIST signal transduction protein [Arsukibacterium sp.]|uniref:FIST signal transduction protein n=1 Tax=Arsukibacterium sp. TaxID=1977258 RepID=UPI00299F4EB8|nr:FIST N-terminal domain-containing protein [Arsukibacterium sp.]MDX1676707.1 FIST N-terminal domain-containing protein [Arsukibacterium sp.]
MQVGIGYSHCENAFSAGQQAAIHAMTQAGFSQADLVLAFCSGTLDHLAFYRGLRAVLGQDVNIFGGSAVGVITNQQLCYQGYPAAVAVLKFEDNYCQMAVATGLFNSPFIAGEQLASALPAMSDASLLLLLYDSVKFAGSENVAPVMNPSAPLLRGIERNLAVPLAIAGAGLLGDHGFSHTQQFCGKKVAQQSASALVFGGNLHSYIGVMHGCQPLSEQRYTITGIFGQFLYTLDGKPAVEVIDQAFGNGSWRSQSPVRRLCLGIPADSAELSGENAFSNRLISGVLPNDEGLILFEPDMHEGMQIQLMRRSPALSRASARSSTEALLARIKQDGKQPLLAIYMDCAGRIAQFDPDSVTDAGQTIAGQEDAAEVQRLLNAARIPLLGFYCGVEIAPQAGKSRGLDWSGVLVILTR